MKDVTGMVVTEIRDAPAVAALGVGDRVWAAEIAPPRTWSAGGSRTDPRPCVVVVQLVRSRTPFGPGSGRIGLQRPRYAVRCYGAPDAKGDGRVARRNSRELAGAVSDVVHQKGPRVDATGRAIHLSVDVGAGSPGVDPDTSWPYETVVISVIAGAQAVA